MSERESHAPWTSSLAGIGRSCPSRPSPPAGTTGRPSLPATALVVPNVVGLSQGAATRSLTHAGLTVGVISGIPAPRTPAGRVVATNPSSGRAGRIGGRRQPDRVQWWVGRRVGPDRPGRPVLVHLRTRRLHGVCRDRLRLRDGRLHADGHLRLERRMERPRRVEPLTADHLRQRRPDRANLPSIGRRRPRRCSVRLEARHGDGHGSIRRSVCRRRHDSAAPFRPRRSRF